MSAQGNGRLGEAEYADLVGRVQEAVATYLPPGSSLLVVNKGDPALLEIPGMNALHFPQDAGGGYAGHHPLDGAGATDELERLRRGGADYLVIPATARWWLDFYPEFAAHLAAHCELVADVPDACLIFGLGRRRVSLAPPAIERPQASAGQIRDYLERLIGTDKQLVVLEVVDGVVAALAPLRATRVRAGDPENDARALAELRLLADDGSDYLVVPRSADDWLDSCPEFAAAVETGCRKVAEQRHLCRIFDLEGLKEIA